MRRIAIPMLLLAAGCVVHVRDHPSRARGHTHVVVEEVRVSTPPPAPPRVVHVKGTCPGPDHVWIDGHYDYVGGRYVWVDARWVVPPKGKRVFVAGIWRNGVWIAGRWQ